MRVDGIDGARSELVQVEARQFSVGVYVDLPFLFHVKSSVRPASIQA